MANLDSLLNSVHFYDSILSTESHSVPYGKFVCTGRGCIGCQANSYDQNGGRTVLPVDVISFDTIPEEPEEVKYRKKNTIRRKKKPDRIRGGKSEHKSVQLLSGRHTKSKQKLDHFNHESLSAKTKKSEKPVVEMNKTGFSLNTNGTNSNFKDRVAADSTDTIEGENMCPSKDKKDAFCKQNKKLFDTVMTWAAIQQIRGKISLLDTLKENQSGKGVYSVFDQPFHRTDANIAIVAKENDKISNKIQSTDLMEKVTNVSHVVVSGKQSSEENSKTETNSNDMEKEDEKSTYCLVLPDSDSLPTVSLMEIEMALKQSGLTQSMIYLVERKNGLWQIWVKGNEGKKRALENGIILGENKYFPKEDEEAKWNCKS